MKLSIIRKILIKIYRIFEYLNYFPRFLARSIFPKSYKRDGKCNGCGNCCVDVGIQVGSYLINNRYLLKIFLFSQEYFNGFVLKSIHKEENIILFKCLHFNNETRKCMNYNYRSLMCQKYPPINTFIKKPEFLEGCGYFPVRKDDIEY